MRRISIDKYTIGDGCPCFIIAEIGSNYNGNLNTARRMIDLVKESGANAVKFQIFKEKRLYPPDAGSVDYLKNDLTINELVKQAEVPDKYHSELLSYCQKKDILYLCTPTDEDVVNYLESIGVTAYKVSSYALTHHRLLRHIVSKGKPILLSTGAKTFEEVEDAVKVIKSMGHCDIALLQCVAQYPADIKSTNLKVLDTFKAAFQLPVGMSDHSRDPFIVPYSAVARGANIIEKHFTLDRSQEGPDHSFAIEPSELIQMVSGIRSVEEAIGSGVKGVDDVELELRRFTERSLFATKDIVSGESITTRNCDILRPGKKSQGIAAKEYESVMGKKAASLIRAGEAIQWDDLD